jgi:hypothetical protein
MTQSTHLALPYLDAAQAQKHVTHNEALQLLDALVHLSVSARDQTAPPASPADGARLLVAAGGTSAFSGRDGEIAAFLAGAWSFLTPRAGWRVFVESEKLLLLFDGASWIDAGLAMKTLQNLSLLGVGATADSANPLIAKLNSALFAARATGEGGSGDLRVSFNKSVAGNTVSHIFETNYSARAETGLAGDDSFRVKVSPDGSSWKEALRVDPSTAGVYFPSAPLRLPQYAKAAAPSAASAGAGALIYVADASGGPALCASDGSIWRMASLAAPLI